MYQLEYPWLLLVLPLPLLVWWLVPPYREETASVRLAFFDDIARAAGLTPSSGAIVPRTTLLQKIVAPLSWALVVLALARPQYVDPPVQKIQPARDLLLALDLSQSMDTADFRDPSGTLEPRVEAVRKVVDDFVQRRSGDRIGLVVFGDAAYPQVPFTLDHTTVRALLADMQPGMAGPRTALGDAIGLAIKLFENSDAPEKVVVLLTDGNDTASRMPPKRAAEIAKQKGVTIHTVAIGDPNGSGENKVDATTLDLIAAATGGRSFFGQDQAQLAQIYATLDQITPANQKTLTWRPKRELFFWPLGGAIALLLLHSAVMVLLTSRRRTHARGTATDAPHAADGARA
jgi:Ca-activated chloride channel family protein